MAKIIVVGGVAGGATAAGRLRRLDDQAEIIMLERVSTSLLPTVVCPITSVVKSAAGISCLSQPRKKSTANMIWTFAP